MRRICFKVLSLSPMQNPSEMGPMRGSKSLAFWDRGGGGGGPISLAMGWGWGGGGGPKSLLHAQEKVINVQPGFFSLVFNKTPS